MLSIKDIARFANVSPATVSRVINSREYVKDEIRERVMTIVKEKGYVPSHAARSMVLRRTFTVGIVIPDTFNMFQRQLFSIIERHLETYGYHTLFFFVKWDPESEQACLKRIKSEKLDGIIMIHEVRYPAFYEYLAESPMPVVLSTFDRPDYNFPAVHVDEESGAAEAVSHLVGLGHRRIGIIAGAHFSFSDQRTRGYRKTLEEHGIEYHESDQVNVPSYSAEAGKRGMERLLASGRKCTAVFGVTDEIAIGAIRALFEAGLSVPEDMSIVGFDDIDITAYLAPGLTTIRQPILDMGARTAEVMSRLISGDDIGVEPLVFTHSLVVRESTEAPRPRSQV